jgi:ubiquinone/menaquinone biosynthesis C-methylase UbiE
MGEGEVAERLRARWPGVPFTGIDLPDTDLAAHWGDRAVHGSFADIAALPYPDDTFDLVLAIEVLEHVPDPEAALREIRRVATDALVVSVPREPIWRIANMARGKYLGALGNTPGHINHWSSRAFASLVGRHATVRSVHRPFPWTMVSATVR